MRIAVPMPPGKIGQTYAQDVSGVGGTGPYTFTTDQQTGETGLPPGVTLHPNGSLLGTIQPSDPNTYTCTIDGTDSLGGAAQKVQLRIFVN